MKRRLAYADGLTLGEVGVKLGISHNAVRSAVVVCGGTLRPAGRRPVLALLEPSTRTDRVKQDPGRHDSHGGRHSHQVRHRDHYWVLRLLSVRRAKDHSRGVVRIGFSSCDDH